jgi:hypothetical protein
VSCSSAGHSPQVTAVTSGENCACCLEIQTLGAPVPRLRRYPMRHRGLEGCGELVRSITACGCPSPGRLSCRRLSTRPTLGACRSLSRRRTAGPSAPCGCCARVGPQGARCRRCPPLTCQCAASGSASLGGRPAPGRRAVAMRIIASGFSAGALGGHPAGLGRSRFHASTPCLRQPDGDRLLGRARSMPSLAYVMHFLADKLTGLGRGRLALLPVTSCSLYRLSLWHRCTPALRVIP